MPDVVTALDVVFREEWARVVAAVIRATGDWDLAEDSAQDAIALALEQWRRNGVPDNPGAWLTTTARRCAVDRLRRAKVAAAKLEEVARMDAARGAGEPTTEGGPDPHGLEDDRLRLIFTCCHPALTLESQVALTLRTLAGLSTAEIARAFLVPEATMAKRLVRAKAKIRHAAIPFRVPPADELPGRTGGALGVLYLLFNEGYSTEPELGPVRERLSGEAIRLTRLLTRLLPQAPEALGLLALMLFHDARRATRFDAAGELVRLEEQDRARWNVEQIEEARRLLEAAIALGEAGPYQVQAAIAACHAAAPTPADTDWAQIAALYDRLQRLVPSAVVALNRAVAVAMVHGPEAGLELVDAIDAFGDLAGYHLLPATRADLLMRLDRRAEAAAGFRRALALAPTDAERRFLERRMAEALA